MVEEQEEQKMQIDSSAPGKKRTYKESFLPEQLSSKFSSKWDLISYMSEHRKL